MIHNDYAAGCDSEKLSAPRNAVSGLESEVLLRKIAEGNDDHGGEHFGYGGVNMEVLNKQLDEDVIQVYAHQHEHKVPEQLHPALQYRAGENDVAVQHVACRKADGERDQEGGDMRADRAGGRVNDFFPENIVVCEKIEEDIQDGVAASASCIAKCLNRHQFPERRVKEINY